MNDRAAPIERLVLIGVGLIGGSLARALKNAGAVEKVIGVARSRRTGDRASALGVIDGFSTSARDAVEGASVVVIATPVATFPVILDAISESLSENTVVTDVGSVKRFVVDAARKHLRKHFVRFVPGHPIAGTEQSGVDASFPELYRHRRVILTPLPETADTATQLIENMWKITGAQVLRMDVDHHDRVLAATSHLPHVVAYALVQYLANHPERETLFQLAAGGFYDFTRIASSDPVMWRDICVTNSEEIVAALRGFRSRLNEMIQAIETRNGGTLEECFKHAKQARETGLRSKNRKPKTV